MTAVQGRAGLSATQDDKYHDEVYHGHLSLDPLLGGRTGYSHYNILDSKKMLKG